MKRKVASSTLDVALVNTGRSLANRTGRKSSVGGTPLRSVCTTHKTPWILAQLTANRPCFDLSGGVHSVHFAHWRNKLVAFRISTPSEAVPEQESPRVSRKAYREEPGRARHRSSEQPQACPPQLALPTSCQSRSRSNPENPGPNPFSRRRQLAIRAVKDQLPIPPVDLSFQPPVETAVVAMSSGDNRPQPAGVLPAINADRSMSVCPAQPSTISGP